MPAPFAAPLPLPFALPDRLLHRALARTLRSALARALRLALRSLLGLLVARRQGVLRDRHAVRERHLACEELPGLRVLRHKELHLHALRNLRVHGVLVKDLLARDIDFRALREGLAADGGLHRELDEAEAALLPGARAEELHLPGVPEVAVLLGVHAGVRELPAARLLHRGGADLPVLAVLCLVLHLRARLKLRPAVVGLDRLPVAEDLFATLLGRNEAEAALVVELAHGALQESHRTGCSAIAAA